MVFGSRSSSGGRHSANNATNATANGGSRTGTNGLTGGSIGNGRSSLGGAAGNIAASNGYSKGITETPAVMGGGRTDSGLDYNTNLWTFSSPESSLHSTLTISPMVGNTSFSRFSPAANGSGTNGLVNEPFSAADSSFRRHSLLRPIDRRESGLSDIGGASFNIVESVSPGGARSLVESLRLWRHDALFQHQLDTAAFIAETVFTMTNDPNDAFWLAQVYYGLGHYSRAYNTLKKSSLFEKSIACRYLAAQCLTKTYQWSLALELLGSYDLSIDQLRTRLDQGEFDDGGIKLAASLCYLRGVVLFNMNGFDAAKKSFQDALRLDVKCYEAFEQLISNNLLSADEEKTFMDELNFDALDPKQAQLTRLLYSIRMNKLKNYEAITKATETLSKDFDLDGCLNLEKCRADVLFAQCKFRECLEVTRKILEQDPYKFSVFPVHVSCLYELNKRNALFLFSNKAAENHPDEPSTWLAVGTYYLCTGKIAEARKYFSKASSIDPKFGPAWIGFAHSFAIEGEHDQAISAYTTAARLFQGSHLPNLFLGMQHLQLTNLTLAEEYLQVANKLCDSDPLLLNEMGAVAYQKGEISKAIDYFIKALEIVRYDECDVRAWASTWTNLGHAYRKNRDFDTALYAFEQSLLLAPQDANTHSAAALVYMFLGDRAEAINHLHTCLSYSPNDTVASDLLRRALEESAQLDPIENIVKELPSINADNDKADSNILDDQSLIQSTLLKPQGKHPSGTSDEDDMEMLSGSED